MDQSSKNPGREGVNDVVEALNMPEQSVSGMITGIP